MCNLQVPHRQRFPPVSALDPGNTDRSLPISLNHPIDGTRRDFLIEADRGGFDPPTDWVPLVDIIDPRIIMMCLSYSRRG
jgi:hypothetical protein